MSAEQVMSEYVGAIRAGDREKAYGLFSDDIVGIVPGRSSLAGRRAGREAVEAYIEEVFARVHGRVEVEMVEQFVAGQHFALLVDERLDTGAGVVTIQRVNVYRVDGDRITQIQIFEGDQYAVDEFLE